MKSDIGSHEGYYSPYDTCAVCGQRYRDSIRRLGKRTGRYDVVQNLATQRVIGYSRTVTKKQGKRNPKVVQENLNIGIQAWELGFILLASGIAAVGAGAYYYFTGSNASNSLSELMKIPMLIAV